MLKLFIFIFIFSKINIGRKIMNVYLISCESYRLIAKELQKLISNNSYTLFNMNKVSINEVLDEASYFSLDNNKKYLVVNNANFFGTEKLKEDEEEKLIRYIENPNLSTILIFTTQNGIDSRKKIVKKLKDNKALINITKLDKRALNMTLTNYLKENDYSIDYNTINYIMDNCYGSLDIMFQELDKIMLYYNYPCTIKMADIKKIIGEEADNNNFHFVDAVVNKDLELALKVLEGLKVYKVEPTVLISLLAREYRLMYFVKKLYKEKNTNEIMNYLSLADWQVNKLYTNSVKFTEKELLDNLVNLCNIDLFIKNGNWDKSTALYSFLMDACS
jgi:DNA polymerase-3 subunit delta